MGQEEYLIEKREDEHIAKTLKHFQGVQMYTEHALQLSEVFSICAQI